MKEKIPLIKYSKNERVSKKKHKSTYVIHKYKKLSKQSF